MPETQRVEIAQAATPADLAAVRELFLEYSDWLGFSLVYQKFEEELAALPGDYAGPRGKLLLARVNGAAAGCGALRQIEPGVCEMKRLYVRGAFRGFGVGRDLAEHLIAKARGIGYSAMRLDTIPEKMADAVRLYRALGFREIPAYYPDARAGTRYFELALHPARSLPSH
jgi:putative acetyltransferase